MQSKSLLLLSALVGVAFAQDDDIEAKCKAWGQKIDSCPAVASIVQLAQGNPTFSTPAPLITEVASCACYDDAGKWQPDADSSLRKECYEWVKTNNPGGIASGYTGGDEDFCSSVGDVRGKGSKSTPATNSASATGSAAEATGTDAEASGGEEASGTGSADDADASGAADASETGSEDSSSGATSIFQYGIALGLVIIPAILAL